ncbi:hypothetical protein ASE29_03405 [Ensifer sp. Root74]|nr:hypothetical protein ASD49_03395 [Ensifer sp. Root1298]KQX85797.1 hypothetical protein ASD41_03365 [Ensifer sp. Root1312]KRC22855.1 hypothetical protein ASE29_03405 [Ensifer sp. Root74]
MTASQRGEAIQKILDALTRHLSGREILSKDALVRLMEDLARILKFPPLPQEGGRDFVRRLVAFLESMPTSDRLLLERQLGGRNLSIRVGLLADLPAIRNGTSAPGGTATPMPAQARDLILRNPSLQPALPFSQTAARTPLGGEVALLQAVLRKTFSVGNDVTEPQGEDLDAAGTEAPSKSGSEKPTERGEARANAAKSASSGDTPIGSAASLLAGEGEIAEAASLSGPIATPLEAHGADEMEAADTIEGEDPDGTYGPLPDADEEDGHRTTAAGRNDPEVRSARVLSEAIKTLIRDSVALPAGAADGDPRSATQQTDEPATQPQPAAKEAGMRVADAAARQRAVTDAGTTLPSLLDDRSEETAAPPRGPADIRPQRATDEQTVQQMIARLVENGLPREAIPFAMIPYPVAAGEVEGEDHSRGMPGGSGEDAAGEDDTTQEGSDGNPEDGEPTGEAMLEGEAPEPPDAYDLYRRLGGLG